MTHQSNNHTSKPPPNLFITASPSLTSPAEIYHNDPHYHHKRLSQIRCTRSQLEDLRIEMSNPCYSPSERHFNTSKIITALKDLTLMENSLGLLKQMEERWSEAEVVTKQIVELRERKENLREEINGLRNVWGYHRFLGGVSEDYLEDLRAGIVRRHDKVKKLKGEIRRLGKREKDLEDEAMMLKMLVMDIERKISVSVRDTKEVEEMKGEEDKSLGSMRFEYRGLIQASFAQSIVKVMGPDKH